MQNNPTRNQITEVADHLFYTQGFMKTSFADIAGKLKISRGNFYYHFKSKDSILDAVVEARLKNTREMLSGWDQDDNSPAARIRSFITILIRNREKITGFGCPVGTLTGELAKTGHPAHADATKIFTLFRNWLKKQFCLMGYSEQADQYAVKLLSRSQGAAVLASAYSDQKILYEEAREMCEWLDALENPATHQN